MFRHERPQKGRYRQFYHFGVEVLGIGGVGIELELIAICQRLWTQLGINESVSLEINSLGELAERKKYRELLVAYFKTYFEQLDDDSKRRLDTNPLRILDSKNPELKVLIQNAPKLIDTIGEESRAHFDSLCQGLDILGIQYTVNPALVRGLDYYGQTVFEWVTDKLGSQATVCAGGRYDKLVEQIGGKPTPSVGFAIGIERLLLLQETLSCQADDPLTPLVFFIPAGEDALVKSLKIAESLRSRFAEHQILVNTVGGGFKSQFKKADKSGASLALILGDDEIKQNSITIKHLRSKDEQQVIPQAELEGFLNIYLSRAGA